MKRTLKKSMSILLAFTLIFGSLTFSFSDVDWTDFAVEVEAAEVIEDGYYKYFVDENGNATITGIDDSTIGEITIPAKLGGYSVTNIREGAFNGCTGLTGIIAESENTAYSSDEYGVLFNKNKTSLIRYPIGNSRTSYTIPDSVATIGAYAFEDCTVLTDITIPDSVSNIDFYAFDNSGVYNDESKRENGALYINKCLVDVNEELSGLYEIKDGTKTIANGAFSDCVSYISITVPNSVKSIGNEAFLFDALAHITVDPENTVYSSDEYGVLFNKDKSVLIQYPVGNTRTSYVIPDGVINLGTGAFFYCSFITNITIPDSVTNIGFATFTECSDLTSVTIPDSVINIGEAAFAGCTSLTSVTIPDSVKNIGESAFGDCTALTSITIPDSVISIGDFAFSGCSGLTNVEIGNGITSIGDYTFTYCTGLTSIIIPDGVTSIGEYAFGRCFCLADITIPDSVTNIGDDAFKECTELSTTYYSGSVEQWNNIYVGDNNSDLTKSIIYECNSEKPYSMTGSCGENITYKLYVDGELEISGKGEMDSWSRSSDVPWNSKYLEVKKLTISDGVTTIGDYAFYFLFKLKNVTIPDSITNVGNFSFQYTGYYYDETNWENDVLYIGNHLIEAKSTVSDSYEIKSGTISIAEKAFSSCSSLTNIIVPTSVTNIGESAFSPCEKFAHVYYTGAEEEWNKISIAYENEPLINATIHFSYDSENEPTTEPVTHPEESTTIPEETTVPVTEEPTTKPVEESTTIPAVTEPSTTNPVASPTDPEPSEPATQPEESTTIPNATEPSTTQPVEEPTTTPVVTEPSTTEPVTTKPAEVESTTKPVVEPTTEPTSKPIETTKPTTTEPVEVTTTKPVVTEPSTTKPAETTNSVIEEEIIKKPSTTEVKYGETLILHADFENIPADAKIEWSVDGEGVTIKPSADGKTCAVTSTATGDATITAKYVDANGVEHVSEQEIESNASFWQKIVSFFKNLFGINRIIEQRIKF